MEACVVICRMKKPRGRKGKIQFINAVGEVTRERAQSFLTDEHLQRIVLAYENNDDQDGFSRLVSLEEIREQDHNLSIPLYVRAESAGGNGNGEDGPSLSEAITSWQESSQELRQSMDALFATLKEADIG
jgi:type I restriction enzyme M protein